MNLKVIYCEILEEEVANAAHCSPHKLDISNILMESCHEKVTEGKLEIQKALDNESGKPWDYILLGWGLCGRMLTGVTARDIPLVLPRSHDCLTMMFGSREAYSTYFLNNSGTYYLSRGWMKHAGDKGGELGSQMQMGELSLDYAELAEQYGEENASYLAEILGGWDSHYNKACLIVQEHDNQAELLSQAKELVKSRRWSIETRAGSLELLKNWLHGNWNEKDFLIVNPGQTICESYDDGIFTAIKE